MKAATTGQAFKEASGQESSSLPNDGNNDKDEAKTESSSSSGSLFSHLHLSSPDRLVSLSEFCRCQGFHISSMSFSKLMKATTTGQAFKEVSRQKSSSLPNDENNDKDKDKKSKLELSWVIGEDSLPDAVLDAAIITIHKHTYSPDPNNLHSNPVGLWFTCNTFKCNGRKMKAARLEMKPGSELTLGPDGVQWKRGRYTLELFVSERIPGRSLCYVSSPAGFDKKITLRYWVQMIQGHYLERFQFVQLSDGAWYGCRDHLIQVMRQACYEGLMQSAIDEWSQFANTQTNTFFEEIIYVAKGSPPQVEFQQTPVVRGHFDRYRRVEHDDILWPAPMELYPGPFNP